MSRFCRGLIPQTETGGGRGLTAIPQEGLFSGGFPHAAPHTVYHRLLLRTLRAFRRVHGQLFELHGMARRAWEESAVFYIIAVICAVILIILVAFNAKKKKDIKKQLRTLEENGQLGAIFQDFSSNQRIFAKKLKLATAGRYVLDFNTPKNGFEVIPLTNVNNVFKCNMIQEQPTTTNYIALETTEGARYLIAPSAKVNSEFETVIAQLKAVAATNVNGGAQW